LTATQESTSQSCAAPAPDPHVVTVGGIHFVDGALGRRPAVLGSGLDVWEIVEVAKDNGGSVADTAAYLEIDPRLVESALRYYGGYRDEIDDWIERVHALDEREESTWRAAQEAIST
jgi:hypothetical protein